MANSVLHNQTRNTNKKYIIGIIFLTFIFPTVGFLSEYLTVGTSLTVELVGKWFIFSAVGLRLFLAGIRQATKPAFTAREIFHIENTDSFPIVRELGFANLCFGLVGLITLFKPEWRIVSAFASGLYYGIAGLQHLIRRPAGANEKLALWTDLAIFILLLAYFLKTI